MILTLGAVWVISTCASFAQAISGFGFSLLAVPLMVPLVGPQGAVITATMLSGLLTLGSSANQRRHVQWRPVLVVSAAAVCGIPLGLLALRLLSAHWLTLIIGAVVIAMTILLAGHATWKPRGRRSTAMAGVFSGALLSSTGMNGPPVVAVFQSLQMDPRMFRASLQVAFLVQDVLAIGGFTAIGGISRTTLLTVATALPWLVVGWWLGDRAFARLGDATFRRIVLGMMLLSGLIAVAQAITGFE